MPIINIDDLNRFAIKYNPTLGELPYNEMDPILTKLKIARLSEKETVKDVLFRRKGGQTRPYVKKVVGGTPDYINEIGKVSETTLESFDCVLPFVDHIKNMQLKRVISNQPDSEIADNISKKHPLESFILSKVPITVSEDILDSTFHAARNEADLSPMGLVDGFYTIVAKKIVSGEISQAKGNYYPTGAITTSNAFTKLVQFIRAANAQLRKKGYLYISPSSYFKAQDALTTELEKTTLISDEQFLAYLKVKTQCNNLILLIDDILGSGDCWVFSTEYNLQLNMNTAAASQFIEVRKPFEDPNYVQFWCQFGLGTRIFDVDQKVFMVNDQLNTGNDLAGDYRS
jgi:hypothetical protein